VVIASGVDGLWVGGTGGSLVNGRWLSTGATGKMLVLLRIPSSRPSPRTFPQFVRVQVLRFLAAENDGFET